VGGSQAGFSLLEILVAVGLLALIIVGLLSMYYQTDKAFRLGTRQVDVLESGRAVMNTLARELQEMTSVDYLRVSNFFTRTTFAPLLQPRGSDDFWQTNILQDYYFITKSNDMWHAIGYFVDTTGASGGVGSLYRFTTSQPGMFVENLTNLYGSYDAALKTAPNNWSLLAENIIHLRITPYDANGVIYSNINLLNYSFPYEIAPSRYESMPAAVDLELGILDPRALERYRAIVNAGKAHEYLTNHADQVYIFRKRIPIRTRQ
jgi:prepilin-type N-terminal cleavage/methylation domain-containing protein